MSHPDYGAVASYMPAPPTPVSRSRPFDGAPKQLPPRIHSTTAMPKHHRDRINSITSSSSIASSGVMSSVTSTLSANISFPDGTSTISAATADAFGMGMTAMGTGTDADEDEGPSSSTSPKSRSGPRRAIAARVFECTFPGCTKAYTQLHNLKSHERTGHMPIQKPKPFHCFISGCTKAFSQRKSLALHIRTSHKEYKFKPFKCMQPGCQKAYTQLHNLRTHEKAVHMLDLSKKRIRNPVSNTGEVGGSGEGLSSVMTGSSSGSGS
ncbi:hypothetical protein BGZ65_007352, partial [Modicella reniformis]